MTIQAFLVDTATGTTIQRMTAGCAEAFAMDLPPTQAVIPYVGGEDIETLETYLDGTLKLRPRTVDTNLQFTIAKLDLRQAVMRRRDRAEFSGCMTALGRMDTDADSQRKINGSVTMALIAQAAGQPFSIEWTMADNATVIHDGPAMIAAGVAVGQHVSACHEHALALKSAIEVAADILALSEIDIEAGWPGQTETQS